MCALPDRDALSKDHAPFWSYSQSPIFLWCRADVVWLGMVEWYGGPRVLCARSLAFSRSRSPRCGVFFVSNNKAIANAITTQRAHIFCTHCAPSWEFGATLNWSGKCFWKCPGHAPSSPFFRNPGSFIIFSLSEHCVAVVKRSIGAFSPRSPTFLFSFRQSRISWPLSRAQKIIPSGLWST